MIRDQFPPRMFYKLHLHTKFLITLAGIGLGCPFLKTKREHFLIQSQAFLFCLQFHQLLFLPFCGQSQEYKVNLLFALLVSKFRLSSGNFSMCYGKQAEDDTSA